MNLRWWNPLSWLVTPIVSIARAIRDLFPWTQDGRRTSLYLAVLGAGPVLTVINRLNMDQARAMGRWELHDFLGQMFAWSLLIIVTAIAVGTGLNIFIKADKAGFTGGAGSSEETAKAARQVADAADEEAKAIEDEAAPALPDGPEYEKFDEEKR